MADGIPHVPPAAPEHDGTGPTRHAVAAGSVPIARPRTRTRDRAAPSPGDSLVPKPAVSANEVVRRVTRVLLLRTLIITSVLGLSIWLLSLDERPARGAMWLQSSLIAATYLSSILFGVLLRRKAAPDQITRAMYVTDLTVTSLLVYSTGGAQSPYAFLFAFSIVGAGALSYRRGAVVVSIAALAALVAVSVLAWADIVPLPISTRLRPWEQTAVELVRTLGINYAALIGVGALAYIFGDQVERGNETLATTRRAAADLLSIHQDIVRSLSSGLITTAPDGTILTANQAAADTLRVPIAALTSQPIDSVMPGLSAQLAVSGELTRADLALSGDIELVLGVTVSPLRDVRDSVIGRVIHFQDLTELRRLEAHIHRAERLATVGKLAAGVAHEIRNPLASISGSIELLRRGPQASEEDRALMAIVHREIQRLNILIGDLLDYANPRSKQIVDFDLAALIDEILQVARGDQAFASIAVTSAIERPLAFRGDPAKLRQVVWNLLRNASDAAATRGKHVVVEASLDDDQLVTIGVIDDGPGIPREQIAHIFDPFYTTKRTGTGLGLATSHAIVAEHGGRIDVESEPDIGTKMLVRLPFPQAEPGVR